ncbi:MAG: Gfo/Idh/MocA family oxidoreductase [Cohaesibacter sp.]|nr:Gfo/Idh/MocA family oxidoreductase [Cohaesibacter sp.]
MSEKLRILVVGLGTMGLSHARAYMAMEEFEIVGLCSRKANSLDLDALYDGIARYENYEQALAASRPDAVCICTWPDSHADYTKKAFAAGADVFLEKPIAETVWEAHDVVAMAQEQGRKLVIGYILRHHPSWSRFVKEAQKLGKPLVMRMNLNQQSAGQTWQVHKNLMASLSPIVDCGVHYLDMMCLMTRARPLKVHAIGARLSDEIHENQYNYGQLQVSFDDGSIGWYEAGWGPMMSETAFFIKDVIGPKGCVSIVASEQANPDRASDDIDSHTKTNALRLHSSELTNEGSFAKSDVVVTMEDEPGHDDLCQREQQFFLNAIRRDEDLSAHMQDAINSLAIVLAADQSVKSGESVYLD